MHSGRAPRPPVRYWCLSSRPLAGSPPRSSVPCALRALLYPPAYPPPCLRPALHAHEDVHHELRLTGATSTKRRTRHDDEGPWRCRGPCADLRRRRRRRRGGRRRPTCLSAISFFSLARPYLTSLTPIDAFILRPSPPQPAKCHFSRRRLNEAL